MTGFLIRRVRQTLLVAFIATLLTILGNLLADVAYAVLDPRVRYD